MVAVPEHEGTAVKDGVFLLPSRKKEREKRCDPEAAHHSLSPRLTGPYHAAPVSESNEEHVPHLQYHFRELHVGHLERRAFVTRFAIMSVRVTRPRKLKGLEQRHTFASISKISKGWMIDF